MRQSSPRPDDGHRDEGMRLFVRVSSLPNPVPVLATQDMTVAAFKRVFLDAYAAELQRAQQPPPEELIAANPAALHPSSFDCRLVCRGQELVDGTKLSVCARPGDHLHALVRAAATTERDTPPPPTTQHAGGGAALRAEAQHWVAELRRFLDTRREGTTAQGTTPGALSGRGNSASAASLPGDTPHQQPMRVHATRIQENSEWQSSTAPVTELGGIDGQTEVVVAYEDALPEGAGTTTTVTTESVMRIVAAAGSSPKTMVCGLACGYFLGLVVLIFIFASRDVSLVFRMGLVIGLLSNVFLGCLLPHSTLVAFR